MALSNPPINPECHLTGFIVENKSLADVSEGESTASLVAYVVSVTWLVCNFAFFVYWKGSYARTRVRLAAHVLTYLSADILFLSGWVLPVAPGMNGKFPCWLMYTLVAMALGCFNATNFTRNTTFMLMTSVSFATQSNGRIPLEDIAKVEEEQRELRGLARIKERAALVWYGLRLVFTPNAVKSKKSKAEHIRTLVALRYVTSFSGSIFFALTCLAPYMLLVVVVCLSFVPYRVGCDGCVPDTKILASMILLLGGILLLFAFMFNYKCKSFPDAWGVFQEETLSATGIGGGFLGFILISFTNIPQRYYFNILVGIMLMVGFFSTTGYQVYMASRLEKRIIPSKPHGQSTSLKGRKTVHKKTSPIKTNPNNSNNNSKNNEMRSSHQVADDEEPQKVVSSHSSTQEPSSAQSTVNTIVSDLKSQVPQLHEVLATPNVKELFQTHCLREFCDENVNFLQDAADWKAAFNDIARTASTARAKKIVNTFIRDKGLQQINLSYIQAQALIKKADGTEQFEEEDFDDARFEVARLLEIGAVARFLRSPEYRSILSGDIVVSAIGNNV